MKAHRVQQILSSLGSPRVLVIGDLILDHYVQGRVERISPEAPIQILRVLSEDYRIGGAGNVAHNLATLGAQPTILGVVGDDEAGRQLRNLMADRGINSDHLVIDRSRATTRKTRNIASGQQILRVDREETHPIRDEDLLVERFASRLKHTDLVIVSDYAKGVLTDSVLQRIIPMAREQGVKLIVDPKGRNYDKYRGATTLTPNLLEARLFSGEALKNDEERRAVGLAAIERLELDALIITLGKDGMFAVEKDGHWFRVRSRVRNVFDVTGAGDTSIATIGLVLAAGHPLEPAMSLANRAGGVVVGKVGAVPITRDELLHSAEDEDRSFSGRMQSVQRLVEVVTAESDGEARVAAAVGAFATLEPAALEQLRRLGDGVDRVVALATSEDGARLLEDLRTVDHTLYSEDPARDLARIAPSVVLLLDADDSVCAGLPEGTTIIRAGAD